jgi:hypothetical protein
MLIPSVRLTLCAAVVICAAGGASANLASRLAYCTEAAAHPEKKGLLQLCQFARQIERAVNDHRLMIDMARDEVIQAWGKPDRVESTTTSDGRTETWYYPDGQYLEFDRLGYLTVIHTTR